MARKSSALLNVDAPLSKYDRKYIARLQKETPEPGCEREWVRYIEHVIAEAQTSANEDAIFGQMRKDKNETSDSRLWPAFQKALDAQTRAYKATLQALDGYERTVAHKRRSVASLDGDVRSMIGAVMEGQTDGIQLSLPLSQIAVLIGDKLRGLVQEFDGLVVPLCGGCNG